MSVLLSLLGGAAISYAIGSPAEWAVHKYILHGRKRNFLNKAAAHAHNDVHHRGYSGPAHYYRDITNEHVVIHFSKGDVALIGTIGAAVGTAINQSYAFLTHTSHFGLSNLGFTVGFLLGSLAYYASYEFTHHYMHVIGQRRLAINRELGDRIQEKPDGKLRMPKSLLDDICNNMELIADRYTNEIKPALAAKLDEQIMINKERANVALASGQEVLDSVAKVMKKREGEYRASLKKFQKTKYWLERKVQKTLRNSRIFQYLDNHHFVHHASYQRNLNVAIPLMDVMMRTNIDCSKKALEKQQYLLCPNSPDMAKFPV